jgi:uncharacterized protein YbjT (DUF2867 family)
MQGAYGVFSLQTGSPEGGDIGEERRGKVVADIARATGIAHLVYSSAGAQRNSGIPAIEIKWRVEQYIRTLGLPATILRPAFFMENFQRFARPILVDGTLVVRQPFPPETALQMIAVDDIAALTAMAFQQPEAFLGKELEIAGDEVTMPQVAEILQRITRRPTRFVEQPIEEVRSWSAEMAKLFEWIRCHGSSHADIPALRTMYPSLMTFEGWAQRTEWSSFLA